ncbi:hypothetical protein C1645_739291 [Glomus cerebriforme]|uniref:Uncharacterized protein n=1 Tax=Glomus cerebriforme TaxID=658196 RepID=A0A397SX37_9GLOM|nr:hypothetical protein C1645_739291 [Glomus cerebriforme]
MIHTEYENYVICPGCHGLFYVIPPASATPATYPDYLSVDSELTETTYQILPLQTLSTPIIPQSVTPVIPAVIPQAPNDLRDLRSNVQTKKKDHRNRRILTKNSFEVIFFKSAVAYVDEGPIPRNVEKKIIYFDDDSADGIIRSIEKEFSELKKSSWGFYKCKTSRLHKSTPAGTSKLSKSHKLVPAVINVPLTIKELKRISGFRKKLYIYI